MKINNLKITKEFEKINRAKDRYVNKVIRPYLVELLRKAQARIPNRTIKFLSGMGTHGFYIDPMSGYWRFSEDIKGAARNIKSTSFYGTKYPDRFPELVEFIEIVDELDDLDYTIGDINL